MAIFSFELPACSCMELTATEIQSTSDFIHSTFILPFSRSFHSVPYAPIPLNFPVIGCPSIKLSSQTEHQMATERKASTQPGISGPRTRQEFYSQLEAVSWSTDGSHVLDYLRNTSLPEKQASDPTLVLFLLECSERKGRPETADTIIGHALSMNASLADEVGGDDRDTLLHSAATKNNAAAAQILLKHTTRSNIKNRIGRTALHAAAAVGGLAVVQVLSDYAHRPISARDGAFLTPLAFAYTSRNTEAARHLPITWASLLLDRDYNGHSPLHVSAMYGHLDVATALLGSTDMLEQQSWSIPMAQQAAQKAVKSTIEWRTREGHTPLWLACSAGHPKMVNFLLSHGADSGAVSNRDETCLCAAVISRRLDVIRRLLKDTAVLEKIHDTSGCGQSVLSLACKNADRDMVDLLLSAGAYCATEDGDHSTPISDAIGCADDFTLELLLKSESFKANASRALFLTDECGEKKTTIFHVALQCDNIKGIKMLLEHGVEPTCRDYTGRTVLHEACFLGNYSAAKLLLGEAKARQESLVDQDGRTALHLASFGGADDRDDLGLANGSTAHKPSTASSQSCSPHQKIMKKLIQKGASIHLHDYRGDSVLHLAVKQGHSQRAAILLRAMDAEHDYSSLSEPNNERKTPLICALEKRDRTTAELIAQKMHIVRFPDSSTRDQLLMWLLTAEKADNLVVSLLCKESCARVRIPSDVPSAGAGVLEWAAFAGSVAIVWHALWALSRANCADPWEILDDASEFAARECERYTSRSFDGDIGDAPNAGDNTEATSTTEMMAKSRETYNDILRLLANPPGTTCIGAQQTSSWSPSDPSDRSLADPSDRSPSDPADGPRDPPTDKYMAQLLEVYVDAVNPDERSIADTIYSDGSFSISSQKQPHRRPLDAQSDHSAQGRTRSGLDIEPNFRWVHLPANNVAK